MTSATNISEGDTSNDLMSTSLSADNVNKTESEAEEATPANDDRDVNPQEGQEEQSTAMDNINEGVPADQLEDVNINEAVDSREQRGASKVADLMTKERSVEGIASIATSEAETESSMLVAPLSNDGNVTKEDSMKPTGDIKTGVKLPNLSQDGDKVVSSSSNLEKEKIDSATRADSTAAELRDTERNQAQLAPAAIITTTSASAERELPAIPTPSLGNSTILPPEKEEMADVARAFGVELKVTDHSQDKSIPSTPAEVADLGKTSAGLGLPVSPNTGSAVSPKSPRSGGLRIGKGPPPTTQASEEKPFDFNRFLDQMRHKSAGPVGEYVRSFIKGFTKKPYRVSDQTKLIFDFLDFISLKMRECEVWSKLNTVEFENATEAMEKLLMNRLYNFTFSPAVRREGKWSVQTDDLERDRVLKQRIRLFGWISEEHLDVPMGSHSKGFIDFAMEELLKINHYKAPRDKVICILNCCKVIFGLIRHLSTEENADTFIPILIYVVLRSNPDHLISNVEYISRFRNPEKLSSESGYYLSSLMGAVAFIETMDYTSLSNITQEQFEANVEAAVEKISAQPESVEPSPARNYQPEGSGEKTEFQSRDQSTQMTVQGSSSSGEESARTLPISAGAAAIAEDTKAFFQRTGEAARAGIGASLGKPMGALGRLFHESIEGPRTPGGTSPAAVSGRATPETPPIVTGAATTTTTNSATSSARSRMWGLFGVDEEEMQRRQQQQHQQQQSDFPPRSTSSSSSFNFGTWGRSMREEEEEPQTPISEELRQGRFATLEGAERGQQTFEHQMGGGGGGNAPRIQRQQRHLPERTGSIDPYSVQEDDVMADGVRTPDGDGSEVDISSPTHATMTGRPRFSDLGGFLPSFLSEQSNLSSSTMNPAVNEDHHQLPEDESTLSADVLDNEEAAMATAQIEQAHLTAGVETLKSIFPDMDPSVCRLILEGCQGDLRKSIDKLLEMSD